MPPTVQVCILRADGTPAADALVSVADAPAAVQDIGHVADAAGRVSIDVPMGGSYLLSIWHEGREQRLRCELGTGSGTTTFRLDR
jgi:hypothetical protein